MAARPTVATLAAALAAGVLLATPAAAESDPCADLLVTHAPDGSTGDLDAVAITSQALERDQPGWSRVGWAASADTSVRVVQVVGADHTRTLEAADTGSAEEALELRFCGTRDGADPSAADDAAGAGANGVSTIDGGITAAASSDVASADHDAARAVSVPRSLLGAVIGLLVGAVVLLMGHYDRRARGAER